MAGEYYKIDEGKDYLIINYPDKGEAESISNCVGIGILNSKLKRGYLGHYIPRVEVLESLVNEAVKDAEQISDLEVVVAGNIPLDREAIKFTDDTFENALKNSREYGEWILNMIQSKGINRKKIKSHLRKNPYNYSYDIFIDTEKGIIEVKKEKVKK